MSLIPFRLEKLRVYGFRDPGRRQPAGRPFVAMFNPTSWTKTYSIDWEDKKGLGASEPTQEFRVGKSTEVTLDLLLDGTGATTDVVTALLSAPVKDRVKSFLDLAYRYNGSIHEPNYLLIEWGALKFACRLSSVTVNYTLFDRDGTPLRATLHATFKSDKTQRRIALTENKSSPDLTHARVVQEGDTLPQLTAQIYGSPAAYMDVARHNDLDHLRAFAPGGKLLFPPLADFNREDDASEEE